MQTRLNKLETENFDAIVLAEAGLKRLGLESVITQTFTSDEIIPAVGQGALGIECRKDDAEMLDMLSVLHDENTMWATRGERSFLRQLEGGCLVPMGVHGTIYKGQFTFKTIFSIQGSNDCFQR